MVNTPNAKRHMLVLSAERIGRLAEVFRFAGKTESDYEIETAIADQIAAAMRRGVENYGTSRWELVDE